LQFWQILAETGWKLSWHICAETGWFWQMNEEHQATIRAMVDEAFDALCKAKGYQSYEEAIVVLREEFRDKATSPAAWILKRARDIYPMGEPDSIRPENLYEILSQIDTLEKLVSVTREMPDEQFSIVENFLRWFLREWLPSKRAEGERDRKYLPQYHRGGGKRTMPGDEECREICKEIFDEYRRTGSIGKAQKNVALRRRLNLRMVQRIKAKCSDYAAGNDKPVRR
jgi:hypothetical protein